MYDSDATELEFYRKIMRTINASIYIMNLEPYRLEWVAANNFVPHIMECSPEELLAQGDFIAGRVLEQPDFKESVELAIERFKRDPSIALSGVYRIRSATDRIKWIMYSQTVIEKDEKGVPTKAVIVALDPSNLLNTPLTLDAFVNHLRKSTTKLLKRNLTAKQTAVVKLLLQNKSVSEIANSMKLSVHTIKDHKKSIFKKLGCKNVKELFAAAEKYGLSE